MNTGQRVFDLRKQIGLNQAEFGKRIGVTRSAICNYENGSRSISEQAILSICREFNVNETWLRTGNGEMFRNVPEAQIAQIVGEFDLDELDQRIILGYLRLSEADRAAVKRLINSIATPDTTGQERTQADTDGQERTEVDIAAKVAELERQNQELAAKVAAMEEEDALMEEAEQSSVSDGSSGGTRLA